MIELIEKAFQEDIPNGDSTTDNLDLKECFGLCHLIAKQDLVLSGRTLFTSSFHYREPQSQVHWHFNDGDSILKGQAVAQIEGNLIQLIQAERVALNFLGFLSGIATKTQKYVNACQGTQTKILDTRKTLPMYRELSKQAVLHGGGCNHRLHLSDAVLIKENHISIAGGLRQAVEQIRQKNNRPIEVEVQNLEQVKEAASLGVNRIMLDNMNLALMAECLKNIRPNIESEASGNMTLERIPQVAALGVNYISVGTLTHSVQNADFSLLVEWNG